jgi:hypothetical protein
MACARVLRTEHRVEPVGIFAVSRARRVATGCASTRVPIPTTAAGATSPAARSECATTASVFAPPASMHVRAGAACPDGIARWPDWPSAARETPQDEDAPAGLAALTAALNIVALWASSAVRQGQAAAERWRARSPYAHDRRGGDMRAGIRGRATASRCSRAGLAEELPKYSRPSCSTHKWGRRKGSPQGSSTRGNRCSRPDSSRLCPC